MGIPLRLLLVATALLLLPLTIGAVSHVHGPGDSCDAHHCFWCVVAMGLAVFGIVLPILTGSVALGTAAIVRELGHLQSAPLHLNPCRAPPVS